jgi:DNA-binding NtrC family response regulator
LPSLSERKEDIPLLIRFFTDKTCVLYDLQPVSFSDDSVSFLCQKEYPGNIRQLKNVVERCILLNSTKDILQPKDVEKIFNANPKVTEKLNLPAVGQVTLEELEILMIKKVFDFYQKSVAKTAAALGITRSSLYRRLEKHNIPYEF